MSPDTKGESLFAKIRDVCGQVSLNKPHLSVCCDARVSTGESVWYPRTRKKIKFSIRKGTKQTHRYSPSEKSKACYPTNSSNGAKGALRFCSIGTHPYFRAGAGM